MARIESNKIVTPKLRLLYNGLVTPYFHEEGAKRGKYSVTLLASPGELAEWQEQMDEVHEEVIQRLLEQEGKKKMPRKDPLGGIYPQVDRDGEETGDLCVKLSHYNKGLNSKTGKEWEIPVKVFDAAGKPLKPEVIARIGRGSIVRCSFTARAYNMSGMCGVSYDLRATQLLVPVWYDGADGSSDDFGDMEEGAYVASEDEVQEF
jgi:hypothetical protein